jgi:predicted nicotinamide N-methyase
MVTMGSDQRVTPGGADPAARIATDGTQYKGPVAVATFRFGAHAIKVVRPVDPDRLLDDPGVLERNKRDDYMPYWAYLWPGAYLLAEAVAREPWPSGPAGQPIGALEIGCGLGLAGLVAMARGLAVQFSDYDRAPLGFVARSVVENGFDASRYSMKVLDWRDLPDERFPVILGADVIYESRLVPLVAKVLAAMLAPGGIGLIASPYRVAAEGFPAAAGALGLTCSAELATAKAEDGRPIAGTIYRVRRP